MLIAILSFIVIVAGVCLKIHHLDFMKKLAAKIVLVYLMLGWLVLCFWMVVISARELYENRYENTREERLRQVEQNLADGRIDYAMSEMFYDKSYEEEFAYAWERGTMYQLYDRYLLFAQTAGFDPAYAREAENYRERLLQVCADSKSPENVLYVEYYLRELEKE